jgi:hypothetical protein
MLQRPLLLLGVFVLTSSPLPAQTLTIEHQPVACVVAGKFPRLEARFAPPGAIATARVLFQPETGRAWYGVAMESEGAVFLGILPRPRKSLKAFRYYIEVTDKSLTTNRTPEYTSTVVSGAADCRGKLMAGALGAASVVLQSPAGAPALPAGFASEGVVTAASTAASASAAAGGGGGFPTLVVVGVVGAAAAGAALAVASRQDARPLEIHGQVFATRAQNGDGVNPVAGAVVSTSIDGATATTDGGGNFSLITGAPKADFEECSVYTITITASGHPTYSLNAPWGVGNSLPGRIKFALSPPWPDRLAIVKPGCP